jgi:hypothetical protein
MGAVCLYGLAMISNVKIINTKVVGEVKLQSKTTVADLLA